MPDKPLIWPGSSRRDVRTFPALIRRWPASSYGASSRDWIRTTGSRCERSDQEFVRSGFTSPVRTRSPDRPRPVRGSREVEAHA